MIFEVVSLEGRKNQPYHFSLYIRFSLYLMIGLFLSGVSYPAMAKNRSLTSIKPKYFKDHTVKGLRAEASLTLQQQLTLPPDTRSVQFQDGKLAEDIQFYTTPRCYLHFKTTPQDLLHGQTLKISKIDNFYDSGSVHLTFWFDFDPNLSHLSCITNYDHTLTLAELKETLGSYFSISFPTEVERDALFNTTPRKNIPVLSEDSSNYNPHSTRVILSDS